jgi:hypothetical protein
MSSIPLTTYINAILYIDDEKLASGTKMTKASLHSPRIIFRRFLILGLRLMISRMPTQCISSICYHCHREIFLARTKGSMRSSVLRRMVEWKTLALPKLCNTFTRLEATISPNRLSAHVLSRSLADLGQAWRRWAGGDEAKVQTCCKFLC